MSADIIKLVPETLGEDMTLEPDKVLEAWKGKLQSVVVLGFTKEDELFCASSENPNRALYLIEKAKKEILLG